MLVRVIEWQWVPESEVNDEDVVAHIFVVDQVAGVYKSVKLVKSIYRWAFVSNADFVKAVSAVRSELPVFEMFGLGRVAEEDNILKMEIKNEFLIDERG